MKNSKYLSYLGLAVVFVMSFVLFTQTETPTTNQLALVTPTIGGETVTVIRQDCSGYEADTCFTSLSAWESAYGGIDFGSCAQGDLVCLNTSAVARIEGTWSSPDTNAVRIDGWTTSASNYIKIYTTTDARHNGVWSDSKYNLTVSGQYEGAISINERFVKIEGLQVKNTFSKDAGHVSAFTSKVVDGEIYISFTIAVASGSGSGEIQDAFFNNNFSSDYSGTLNLWNNIAYNWGTFLGYNYSGEAIRGVIYNNTIVNSDLYGIYARESEDKNGLFLKNNIVSGSANGDYEVTNPEGTVANISSDGTSPDGISYQNKNISFVSTVSGSEDFHLSSSDTSARDAGTNLSGDANLSFTTDIDGETRSGAWDIGADEQSGSAPPPPVTYQCNDGTDNDSDGLTDYPNDPGCSSSTDNDEYNAPILTYQCNDGTDNDSDGLTDYPSDPGCSSSTDNDEYNSPPSDTTAPSVPTNLSVTAVSSSQINLSWSASTDNIAVTGYRIYRNGTQITTTTNTSYSNTGLSSNTTYSYTVSAYDAAGNVSNQSSSRSATTQSGTTPPPTASPANYPLEIIQPQPSLNTNNRYYKAYPGIEYEVPVGVFGGSYPFTYSLTTAPSGMTIDSSTGIITWSNPTINNSPHNVTARVVDAEGSVDTVSWTITVTTAGFVFIDANTDANGTGTLIDPFDSLEDIWGPDGTLNTYNDYFLYFRGGTYGFEGGWWINCPGQQCGVSLNSNSHPIVWIGYPGETVTIDHNYTPGSNGGYLRLANGADDLWMSNLNFRDGLNHNLRMGGGALRKVIYGNTFSNGGPGLDGSNSSFIMFTGTSIKPENYTLVKDNVFETGEDFAYIKSYSTNKAVYENNIFQNVVGNSVGLALKAYDQNVSVRKNTFDGVWSHGAIAGNWNEVSDFDISFNRVLNARSSYVTPWYGAMTINYHGTAGPAYIYRNTFEGLVTVEDVATEDGPFYIYNNVIVNEDSGTPTGSHVNQRNVHNSSRLVIGSGSTANLVGYPSDNIIDANGNLTAAYSSYLGTHGHAISGVVTPPITYACSDNIDNDSDGLTDYPSDPGCSSSTDNDEYNAPILTYQCNDGTDNDSDGLTDYPSDPGCSSSTDNDEYNAPIITDTEAPTNPTISINNGNTRTNSTNVNLTLSATDNTAVTQMQFSNTGTSYSNWETYNTSKTWTLSSTNGTKTVYVKYRDAAGNVSNTVSDNIILDNTAPSISNISVTTTSSTTAMIRWNTNEQSTTQLEYGFTTNYGTETAEDTNLTTEHSVSLNNLSPDNTTYHYRVKSTDISNNQGISTDRTFVTPGLTDTTSPSTITDLASSNITQTSADLTWSAPGDDGTIGTSAEYDIRYSTDTLTSANWPDATEVTGEPIPSVSGTQETIYLTVGLNPNTTYYMAIRSRDDTGNLSNISNVITFTTLAENVPPPVVIPPPGNSGGGGGGGGGVKSDTIPPGAPSSFRATSADSQVTLSWTNPSDKDFARVVILRSTNIINTLNQNIDTLRNTYQVVYEGKKSEYTDANLNNNQTYYYAISAYDKKPNYSNFSILSIKPEAGKESFVISEPEARSDSTTTQSITPLFTENLWFGLENDNVKKLQEIFARDKSIYPEGITTGYFGTLTQKAVQRFQAKYGIVSSGTPSTTGYGAVGPKTRAKINEVYGTSETTSRVANFVRLTLDQINSILDLLIAFGTDNPIVETVRGILMGE